MPALKHFNLPDVGEGLTEAEIVSWKVKPGDSVKVNDIVVEIETAKSLVELPVPFEGVVERLCVAEGVTVEVGTPIITVNTNADGEPEPPAADTPSAEPEGGERQSVLVGYGPRTGSAQRRPRKPGAVPTPGAGNGPGRGASAPAPPVPSAVRQTPPARPAPVVEPAGPSGKVLAKPPVRKLARDLGVDLGQVQPTGPAGTISREDVHAAAAGEVAAAPRRTVFDPASREQRVPVRGVRKATAQAMVASAFTAPHVSEFLTVDVTRTVELVARLRESREFRDVKVSPLLVLAKAMLLAIRRHPEINASWDEENQEIVIKEYVNLGIAAATPRGLLVPNVKDAGALSLPELATAINDLVAIARAGRTTPADTTGGTITITNVGVFGIDSGTPILPPGEAAILAFGAIRPQPWVHQGAVVPREVTTLALSFDHRLVDGELGSRFLADVGALMADPDLALVWS
jgi:pyruvate dehydrogenase E2 component (dihydrolipoamide acetyltransferase)